MKEQTVLERDDEAEKSGPTISRRNLLRAAFGSAGVLSAAAILAACGGGAAPASSQAASSAAPASSAASKPAAASSAAPASSKPAASSAAASSSTTAAGPLKVGYIVPTSGPNAPLGEGLNNGFRLYLDQVGNKAGGRTIQILQEDETSDPKIALDKAKKLVEQDKVDVLAGVVLTPIAYAIRDYIESNAPRKLMFIVTNAGGNDLDGAKKSQYVVRTSFSNAQATTPMGPYLFGMGKKKAFVTGLDYAAGHEKIDPFKKTFAQAGGQIVGETYAPLSTTDFAPYLTKIAASNAEFTFAFYSGADGAAFVKQYAQFGLNKKMLLSGTGDMVDDTVLPAEGDAALGALTALHWYSTVDNPQNKKFLADYKAKYNKDGNAFAVQAYDGAHLLVDALNKTNGSPDPAGLLKAMQGAKWDSPRGPVSISPELNDIIQNIYVAEVKKVGGKVTNVVNHTFEAVKPA